MTPILTQIQSLKHTIAHAVQEHKLVMLVAKQIRRETRDDVKTMREIERKINQLGPLG